jgi:hypothetical protein
MPQERFEPRIPVFEWAKTVHALDRAVTVIGSSLNYPPKNTGRLPNVGILHLFQNNFNRNCSERKRRGVCLQITPLFIEFLFVAVPCYFLFLVPKYLSQHFSLTRSVYVGDNTQSLETLKLPLHLLLYQASYSCISFLLYFSVGCFTWKWFVESNMNITFWPRTNPVSKYGYSWYMKLRASVEIYDGPYQ